MRPAPLRWIAGAGAAIALGFALNSVMAGPPVGSAASVDRGSSAASTNDPALVPLTAPDGRPLTTSTTTMPPRAEPAILAPTASGVLDTKIIVVDPGHNGKNFQFADVRRPGPADGEEGPLCNTAGSATNSGVREVDLNWKIGTRLADILRSLGAAVVLSHADNSGFGPCADERGRLAQTANADVLISIHADGAPGDASGFHLIHPAAHPNLRDDSVVRSAQFAALLRDELVVIGGRPATYVGTRGVQERSDLATLNNADRPSVLAELGNLRNLVDAAMITDPRSHELFARAMARGIVRMLAPAFGTQIPGRVSADLNGDGLVDLLPAAPAWMLPTTTTTTTAPAVVGAPELSTPSPLPATDPETTTATVPPTASGTPSEPAADQG